MALISCPECGKQVSDKAAFCPNCGCPRSEWEKKEISSQPAAVSENTEPERPASPPIRVETRPLFMRRYWRNSEGKIRCPGDTCPVTCTENCPIYLNTLAVPFLKEEQYQKAIPLLKKAVGIEPGFVGVWRSLGACYGSTKQYAEALDCYTKAHELAPDDLDAIFGLAAVNKDLRRYEESLQWCYVYKKYRNDTRILTVEKQAKQGLPGSSRVPSPDIILYSHIVPELVAAGSREGYRVKELPNILEVMAQADFICSKLNNTLSATLDPNANIALVLPVLCAYAGMGAARLWKTDRSLLLKKGAYSLLTEPFGVERMDEYVTALIGLPLGSQTSADLKKHMQRIGLLALKPFTQNNNLNQIPECLKAMFRYGMILEMNRPETEEKSADDKPRPEKPDAVKKRAESRSLVFIAGSFLLIVLIICIFCFSNTGYLFANKTVSLNKSNGTGGSDKIVVKEGGPMPSADPPQRSGYIFAGYYSAPDGKGKQYYDSAMNSVNSWDNSGVTTLYAFWKIDESVSPSASPTANHTPRRTYKPARTRTPTPTCTPTPEFSPTPKPTNDPENVVVLLKMEGGSGGTTLIFPKLGQPMPYAKAPVRPKCRFLGYFTEKNGRGTQYYDENMNSVHDWENIKIKELYAFWR